MKSVLALMFAAVAFACLCAGNARGQATWGAISGFVSDSSGAMVSGANVTVTEVRTGIVTKATTDTAGFYNITHLLPGDYAVSVEAQGFKRFTQEHVNLQVDSTGASRLYTPTGPSYPTNYRRGSSCAVTDRKDGRGEKHQRTDRRSPAGRRAQPDQAFRLGAGGD